MTDPLQPDPTVVAEGPEQRFLQQVLHHLDREFGDDTHLEHLGHARDLLRRRNTVLAETDADTVRESPMAVLGAELHRARRTGALISIRTRGGHRYRAVRVEAVHRHHARLTSHTHQGVLLPLAFIESLHHLDQELPQ
ncbi:MULTISPECIES: hypothetical protein [Nocardia]|uniref:hypothetical protein n=1 Tax=Nocardia TaxID=1817 RepID=UPI00082F19FE|nr:MULTISPECIES: hypothetical protein [Nocardia]